MTLVTKHFITIGHRQVHYRRAGSGPALLLLHTSPLSSSSLEPMIAELCEHYTVIAPDAPGHGLTRGLKGEMSVERLADSLASLINALELDNPVMVGTGSGAHAALVFAVRHGVKASAIICLDMPVWNEREIKKLGVSYESFITAMPDGSHLLRRWHALRSRGDSLDECQTQMIEMLTASSPLIPCEVQHYLDNYKGSSLHIYYDQDKQVMQYAGRLQSDHEIKVLPHSAIIENIIKCAALNEVCETPQPPEVELVSEPGITRAYGVLGGDNVVIHGRAGKVGAGSLLLLHEPGFSASEFNDYVKTLAADITLMAPEMPAKLVKPAFISDCIAMMSDDVIIVARGGASALVLEHLNSLERPINGLILDEPILNASEATSEAKAFLKVPTAPSAYGEHLISLYGRLRDRAHYWPWHSRHRIKGDNKENADRTTHQLIAALKAGKAYQKLFKYVGESNITEDAIAAPYPLVILADADHPTSRALRRICQQSAQAIMLEEVGAVGVMSAMQGLGVRS